MPPNQPPKQSYVIRPAPRGGEGVLLNSGPAWEKADRASIDRFRPESSSHHPQTVARLLHSEDGIYGMFQVKDRFVRCVRNGYHSEVWKDSCVEFFVQPVEETGYFNFEFNCGGSLLCNYIRDHRRTENGFADCLAVSKELASQVQVRSTLPKVIDPEMAEEVDWTLNFFIPYTVMEHFVGPLKRDGAHPWTGNFFKCAEDISHPHWASWSPVDEFNFHLPRCFGRLHFAPTEGEVCS